MKLDVGQKVALVAASFVAVVLCIMAGSSASGGGGPGFNSQNNGNHFGEAAAGGPGFGQGNNSGGEGTANGRSIASDAASGRSDGQASLFHSSDKEEVIEPDVDTATGKARNEGERDTNQA